jgi:hypothetical protein
MAVDWALAKVEDWVGVMDRAPVKVKVKVRGVVRAGAAVKAGAKAGAGVMA